MMKRRQIDGERSQNAALDVGFGMHALSAASDIYQMDLGMWDRVLPGRELRRKGPLM